MTRPDLLKSLIPRRSRIFGLVAGISLIGLNLLIAFATSEFRSASLSEIERLGERELLELTQSYARETAPNSASHFEGFALNRLRNPDIALIGLAPSNSESTWVSGNSERPTQSLFHLHLPATGAQAVEQRIQRHGRRILLESARSTPEGIWVIGRDITQLVAGFQVANSRLRLAQAGASIVLMLGLWLLTRSSAKDQIASSETTGSAEAGQTGGFLASSAKNRSVAQASKSSAPAPPPPLPVLSNAWRVLLVEDNPVNQTIAQTMLEDMGCRVTTAEDGLVCLEQMKEAHFDLVFMDIQMPRMDGLEATRRIRAAEARQERKPVPIVALTAHSHPQDRAAAHQAGMNDLIAKPFTESQLFEALKTFCESRKSEANRNG
ncbi:MAG: response regulator [Myxococcota bacterium]